MTYKSEQESGRHTTLPASVKNHGQGHLEMNKQYVINLFNPVTSKPDSSYSYRTLHQHYNTRQSRLMNQIMNVTYKINVKYGDNFPSSNSFITEYNWRKRKKKLSAKRDPLHACNETNLMHYLSSVYSVTCFGLAGYPFSGGNNEYMQQMVGVGRFS
jgi:hypothetical protein